MIDDGQRVDAAEEEWSTVSQLLGGRENLRGKWDLYRRESHFREAWGDLRALCAEGALGHTTFLLCKPDLLVTGGLVATLDMCGAHGLVPVAHRWIRLERVTTLELWRYQWNAATLDRIDLSVRVFGAGPSLLVILRDWSPGGEASAAERLAFFKGSSRPERRAVGSLRALLGAPNRTFSLLHCPEDGLDLVRELGILFCDVDRTALLRCAMTDPVRTIEVPEDSCLASRDLTDVEAARDALLDALGSVDPGNRAAEGAVEYIRSVFDHGAALEWKRLRRLVEVASASVDPWDLYVFGASFLVEDVEGEHKLLG